MALDRDQVVRRGLELLDEVGLEGLTLRRLADALGVKAPALYWHFKSKQDLLDEMATAMFRDLMAPQPAPQPAPPASSASSPCGREPSWQDQLRAMGHGLRRMVLSRRDGARMIAGTYLTDDSLLAAMEGPLRTLTEAGFDLRDAVRAFTTVHSYVMGFTIEEQAVAGDDRYGSTSRRARIDGEKYPLTSAASSELFADPDGRFASGLELIVGGLAATR